MTLKLWSVRTCTCCGGHLNYVPAEEIWECPSCRVEYTEDHRSEDDGDIVLDYTVFGEQRADAYFMGIELAKEERIEQLEREFDNSKFNI